MFGMHILCRPIKERKPATKFSEPVARVVATETGGNPLCDLGSCVAAESGFNSS
ncbi:hypothetical protein D9M72_589240 [compost metagenome]